MNLPVRFVLSGVRALMANPWRGLWVALVLVVCSTPVPGQAWQTWRFQWDAVDLWTYFPNKIRLEDRELFDQTDSRGLTLGPSQLGVLEWPEVIRVRVRDGRLEFLRPPQPLPLFAGVMHQALLVEISSAEEVRGVVPLREMFDARDRSVLRLLDRGLPTLYLVRVSDPPLGAKALELVVEDTRQRELGRLLLPIEVRESGRLRVEIRDADTGRPTPARVGIYSGESANFTYPRSAIQIPVFGEARSVRVVRDPTWPIANRSCFYTEGVFETAVPPGRQHLIFKKGIEYGGVERKVLVEPGATVEQRVVLERSFDLPEHGWYSGDAHVHVARDGEQDASLLSWSQAEDVHVTHTLQMGDVRRTYFPQFSWQDRGTTRRGDYLLSPGQEDPRSSLRGHTILLNNAQEHWNPEHYYLYEDLFQKVRQEGGLAGYAHAGTAFHADRSMALSMPLGVVDLLEVFNNGVLKTPVLYHWWNLGFSLTPIGGCDYPFGRMRMLGDSRFYAQVDGPLSPDSWIAGLRGGNTYVSNGPLVEFQLGDAHPGERSVVAPGSRPTLRAHVRCHPSVDRLKRVCVVQAGEIVQEITPPPESSQDFLWETSWPVQHSTWIALKVEGEKTLAHTNAIFLEVNGQRPWNRRRASALLDRSEQWLAELEQVLNEALSETESGRSQLEALAPRFTAARQEYRRLRRQLSDE